MRFDDPNTGKVFMDYLATNLDGIPDTYNSSFKDPISAILGNAISYNFYNFVPYFYGYRIPTIGWSIIILVYSTILQLHFPFPEMAYSFP